MLLQYELYSKVSISKEISFVNCNNNIRNGYYIWLNLESLPIVLHKVITIE